MNPERLRQKVQTFQKAVERLEDACRQPENEFIRDSVIQRFEFCHELAWKMLKARLELEGMEANTPRQVIEQSVTARFIQDGNRWTELQRMRNLTSHTYDEALAGKVYGFVCREGLELFRALREESSRWLP